MHFAYYCTGHGLGHATRVVEVAQHITALCHAVTICSGANVASLLDKEHPNIELRSVALDCGSVQADAFSVDMRASLAAYHALAVQNREQLLEGEVAWLTAAGIDLVVSDTVPLACAAAHRARLPAVVCSNFAWDFVYAEYLAECGGVEYRQMVFQIAEDFARATLLRLPGYCPMPAFAAVEDVPLVARPPRQSPAQVRTSLGIGLHQKLVLLMYGGQPAGAWRLRESALPPHWRCVACSGGKPLGDADLPSNFTLAAADAYTPDLVAAADVVLGKIGYGTTSECLSTNTPLVYVRRQHFNEEPFLRGLLQLHGAAIEMKRRDFISGNWADHILQAASLTPSYSASSRGAEVVAARLVELARPPASATPTPDGPAGPLPHCGSLRLADSVIWGFCMARNTQRRAPKIPSWYTAGMPPPLGGTDEDDGAADTSSSSDEADTATLADAQTDWSIVQGDFRPGTFPDTARFLRRLAALSRLAREGSPSPPAAPSVHTPDEDQLAAALFDWQDELTVARAPGRLDVMGGIADYGGSLVLQLPLALSCHVAAQLRPTPPGGEPTLSIVSLGGSLGVDRAAAFDMPLSDFAPGGTLLSLRAARGLFTDDTSRSWAAYVAGGLLALAHEHPTAAALMGVAPSNSSGPQSSGGGPQSGSKGPPPSLAVLVASEVPAGAGVSSSAALEVASMTALAAALQLSIPPRWVALLCQQVENQVVGAPCGVMDQMASALGRPRRLLSLVCRPAHLQPPLELPPNLRLWGVDSGIRHSVSGADYGTVRAAAFMGLALCIHREAQHGTTASAAPIHSASGDSTAAASRTAQAPDPTALAPGSGERYLCTMSASHFQGAHEQELPDYLPGAHFLKIGHQHMDTATTVLPSTRYPVKAATAHPIMENFRVEAFRAIMQGNPTSTSALLSLGELMFQSHASYSRVGLGSKGTDTIVGMVRRHISDALSKGVHPVLYGARITGGGSGGTVCILGAATEEGQAAVDAIAAEYHDATKHRPMVFAGSSPGAAAFGTLQVQRLT